MVGSIIDLVPKILNNPIPDPNPKPNPYQNRLKVKQYKKKSLVSFKNKKSQVGFEPRHVVLEVTRLGNGANNALAGNRQNNFYL